MDFIYLLLLAVLFLAFWIWFPMRMKKPWKLPPGPFPYPIIGNIHQIGQFPYRSLAKFAQSYGPLFSLRLGSIYTVVVSSPELAKEILQKHSQASSGRMVNAASEAHDHHKLSVAILPAGAEWRKLRKLSHEHLFSVARLEASRGLRQEKLQTLVDYLHQCCHGGRVVDIGEAAFTTTFNLMSVTLFSEMFADFDSDDGGEFRTTFLGFIRCMATPNLADFFPVFKPFDLQGLRKQSEFYTGKLLAFIEDLINKRLGLREEQQHPDSVKKTDFLETLLDFEQGSDYHLSIDVIKHFLMDLLVAGSDTTASTIEWIMTELLINPDKLSKVREELRMVIGDEHEEITESDFSRLPYLDATIKESLRFHTPSPFLLPHKAESDIEINGYTIPSGTQLLVNAWAIARDPSRWDNPDSFEPERFLRNRIDYKGQHFELLPFGAGKRICPGMALANRVINMVVATLIHKFDWELQPSGEVENAEKFVVTLRKAVPLKATPIKLSGG